MSNDIETRLSTLLRERAEDIDFDPAGWVERLDAAPRPSRRRRFAVAAIGLGVAAGLAAALSIGGGLTDTKPAPDAAATSTLRNAPLVGTWRLSVVDGRPVSGAVVEGTVTFAESGWWRADAGCVAVGGWFVWAPATGNFAAGDYDQPSPMPPKESAGCYSPTILSVIWPGRRLVPIGKDLMVLDQEGKEQARLSAVNGENYHAPRLTGASSWRVSGVGASSTLVPDERLFGTSAPWTWLTFDKFGGRVRLTLTRPAGSAPACRLARVDADLLDDGRIRNLDVVRDPRTSDGDACKVYPAEQTQIDNLLLTRALATNAGELVALGDGGSEVLALRPAGSADSRGRGFLVTDPEQVSGTWWVRAEGSESAAVGADEAQVRVFSGEQGALTAVVTAPCGIVGGVSWKLGATGELTDVAQNAANDTCADPPPRARAALAALPSVSILGIEGGDLPIGPPDIGLTDLPPMSSPVVINEPQPHHPATVDELLGDWRLDYARLDAAGERSILGSTLSFSRDAAGMLTVAAHGCNSVWGPVVFTEGRVLESGLAYTARACGPTPGEPAIGAPSMWFDDRVAEARSYAMTSDGRLLVLSRSNHPILGFSRAD